MANTNKMRRKRVVNTPVALDEVPNIASICSRSEEHTSELQSRENLVCRLLLEKKKIYNIYYYFLYDYDPTQIYTLSLHDALPIYKEDCCHFQKPPFQLRNTINHHHKTHGKHK